MGARYELSGLRCAHCDAIQESCYFAESSGFFTHKCDKCRKVSNIAQKFTLEKISREHHAQLISDFTGNPIVKILKTLGKKDYE